MMIAEPITTLTDYAIALESIAFAGLLSRIPHKSVRCWAVAFAAVGIAAFTGGSLHGFAPHLEIASKLLLWKITLYAIGISSCFLLAGTIISAVSVRVQPWLLAAIGLKSLVYLGVAAIRNSFGYVVADYLSALVIVLLLQVKLAQRQSAAVSWIVSGIGVSAIAALILSSRFKWAIGIKAVDIYHLVQMVALYLLYKGASQLKDFEAIATQAKKNP
jgi:hypothetical protein